MLGKHLLFRAWRWGGFFRYQNIFLTLKQNLGQVLKKGDFGLLRSFVLDPEKIFSDLGFCCPYSAHRFLSNPRKRIDIANESFSFKCNTQVAVWKSVRWSSYLSLSLTACGLNLVSFQQTLKCFSRLLIRLWSTTKCVLREFNTSGRYRRMTFIIAHFFPPSWKAVMLRNDMAESSNVSFAWKRRLKQTWASWRETERKQYRNCGLCTHECIGFFQGGEVLPTHCLITVVVGHKLRHQLIFCFFRPGFTKN